MLLYGFPALYPCFHRIKIEVQLETTEGLIKKLILTQGSRKEIVSQTFSLI